MDLPLSCAEEWKIPLMGIKKPVSLDKDETGTIRGTTLFPEGRYKTHSGTRNAITGEPGGAY